MVRSRPRTLTDPVLAHRFDHPVTGIAEVEPGLFVLSLAEGYTTHESHLVRLDLNGWAPGTPAAPEVVFTFDDRVRALNGSCLLGPGVLAIADCFAGLIWRVDLGEGARSATARVWAEHALHDYGRVSSTKDILARIDDRQGRWQ